MKQYLDLLQDILDNGDDRSDRTGTGTRSVFGRQLRFDLRAGFPAVTTKKLAWKAMCAELIWFLEGSTDERRLAEILHGTRDQAKNTIWTGNANADYWLPKAKFIGDLGPVYGKQWRDFGGVDQVTKLVKDLKENPYSRRHIISAWNVPELDSMALPPCHILSQFYVNSRNELSCEMYQRSQDVFLGAPFNYASYALLTHIIAQECGFTVGDLIVSTGDTHVYLNHIEQVKQQLSRTPHKLPTLWLANKSIFDLGMDDMKLVGYTCDDAIKAPMAV